jgi:hypothetical protein
MIRGGKVRGGDCSGCGIRVKIFSPLARGVHNWTMEDKKIIRDMLHLCNNCWISFTRSKEGIIFCKDWETIKKKYLINDAYFGNFYEHILISKN